MLSAEQMAAMLSDRNLMEVSRSSGVSYQTVTKVAAGRIDRLQYAGVKKLSDYLERRA